jgi:hypothetical protein
MTGYFGPWSGFAPVPVPVPSPARPNGRALAASVAAGGDDNEPAGIPTVLAATATGTMANDPIGRVVPPFGGDHIRRVCAAAGRAEFGAIFPDP